MKSPHYLDGTVDQPALFNPDHPDQLTLDHVDPPAERADLLHRLLVAIADESR